MERIELSVPGEVPYEIVLGQGILPFLGEELEALSVSRSLMVITDTEVGKRYLPTLKTRSKKRGFKYRLLRFLRVKKQNLFSVRLRYGVQWLTASFLVIVMCLPLAVEL